MEKLQIGKVIQSLRKTKKITQEELANYIGISKGAVSKWESGVSYPDITVLPSLATFFGVSIDKLLNFNVELSEDELKEICKDINGLFSKEEYEEGCNYANQSIKKYKHSYKLKYEIANLYLAYTYRIENQDDARNMRSSAKDLYEDILTLSIDEETSQNTHVQLGSLCTIDGDYDEAIEHLTCVPKANISIDTMLANIYILKDDDEKAKKILQETLYRAISEAGLAALSLSGLCSKGEQFNMSKKYIKLSMNIKKACDSEKERIIPILNEYFSLAVACVSQGNIDDTYKYLELAIGEGNETGWGSCLKKSWCFDSLDYENEYEQSKFMNVYEAMCKIVENEAFDDLKSQGRYKELVKKVYKLKEENK